MTSAVPLMGGTISITSVVPLVGISGEVNAPTRLPFQPGATVGDLLKAAGGFTAYADRRRVEVRNGTAVRLILNLHSTGVTNLSVPVRPGDMVIARRRFL